jgi:hypothetical protein
MFKSQHSLSSCIFEPKAKMKHKINSHRMLAMQSGELHYSINLFKLHIDYPKHFMSRLYLIIYSKDESPTAQSQQIQTADDAVR